MNWICAGCDRAEGDCECFLVERIDDERPVCPICLDETFGRPCETSYCAGYEAGRLAAIRAEVVWALRHMRREAIGFQRNADALAGEARWLMAIDEPLADDEEAMPAHSIRSQVNAGRLYEMAREATARVAQTERWLEATR